jgi:hypothetical protein
VAIRDRGVEVWVVKERGEQKYRHGDIGMRHDPITVSIEKVIPIAKEKTGRIREDLTFTT